MTFKDEVENLFGAYVSIEGINYKDIIDLIEKINNLHEGIITSLKLQHQKDLDKVRISYYKRLEEK